MILIPDISFGNKQYRECEGGASYVESYAAVSCDDFNTFVSRIKSIGYTLYESHVFSKNEFLTFADGNDALFLSYYPDIQEMRLVEEENSTYLFYSDCEKTKICKPLLTHVDIEAYGISYVIRLSDSRFIIFDGGYANEPDADKLMDCLTSQSTDNKPCIAAWVFTHPHSDHYPCFNVFYEKYSENVEIEKIILNFPDISESSTEKIPALETGKEIEPLNLFYDMKKKTGAHIYRAHTGQVYKIGDAVLEILSSPDDAYFTPINNINHLSLVIKMTISNQTIMWCADADFKAVRLAERYGDYLKCDIVQLTHHGYDGGEKEEYSLMNPSVCLAPVTEEQCLSTIDIYNDYNKYLFCDLELQELICGGNGNVVLPLPHKPLPNSRVLLANRINERQKDIGAKTWYFADVSPDELDFTFINMTYSGAQVYADLIYANSTDNVYYIKFSVPSRSSVKKNITDPGEVDGDAYRFNPYPLSQKGVKKGELISVRFTSSIPIVVSGSKSAAYCH